MSGERTIRREIEIAAPVADVWKAITESEQIQRWFPLDAKVEPGLGGEIHLKWGDKYEWIFKVDVWLKEKHLRLVYNHETDFVVKNAPKADEEMMSDESRELAVDYYLDARAGKTVLRLVHSGFGADASWDQEYDGASRGWTSELQNLKYYLERHSGRQRTEAWVSFPAQRSLEDIWMAIMGPDGLNGLDVTKDLNAGDPYEIKTPDGDLFRGKILHLNPPQDFMVTVENQDHAILRIHIEDFGSGRDVNFWLIKYGLNAEEAEPLRSDWAKKVKTWYSE